MRDDEPADPPDAELLRRHTEGDRDAFGELVRRHRDRLWAVALRTLGDPDDAADALQDGLLSAYRSAAGFRGESRVSTWLHRIVVNACIDRVRRRQAHPTSALVDSGPADPRDPIGERETALDVVAALRALPVEQAAALVLVDVEGHPVEEAARILDVPVGTVKSRCARGRARLAGILAPPGGNPPGAPGVPFEPGTRAGDGGGAP